MDHDDTDGRRDGSRRRRGRRRSCAAAGPGRRGGRRRHVGRHPPAPARRTAEITVVERSGHVSYANCGLPYFVGGMIEEEDDLLLQTPERLHERFRLDVRVDTEVVDIDAGPTRSRSGRPSTAKTYDLVYDKLVLSPGCGPGPPADPRVRPGARAAHGRGRRAPGRRRGRRPGDGGGHRRRLRRARDGGEPRPAGHRRDRGGGRSPGPDPPRPRTGRAGGRPNWSPTASRW